MATQLHSYLSRSQLLKTAMFAQRAVDYAVKSYELGTLDIQRLFSRHHHDWLNLNSQIADRGSKLVNAGNSALRGLQNRSSAMEIYGALQVTYLAASEITHSAALLAPDHMNAPSLHLLKIGSYVTSLMRLCTVALFKNEEQHAQAIISNTRGRQWFELTLFQLRCQLVANPSAQAGLKMAIADALEHIAEQAHEIARAISLTPRKVKTFDQESSGPNCSNDLLRRTIGGKEIARKTCISISGKTRLSERESLLKRVGYRSDMGCASA